MNISVVIPCYNREETIYSAVASVRNQLGEHNIDIIVVDDGSSDDSLEKIKSLEVTVLKTNGRTGACNARNIGILAAKHEWIAFNDSDDLWRHDKLNLLEKELSKNSDVAYFFHPFIRTIGLDIKTGGIYQDETGVIKNDEIMSRLLVSNLISTQCLIVNKNTILKKGLFDINLKRFQDWELALRVCNNTKGVYISEFLCFCIESVDSISKNYADGISSREYIFDKHRGLYGNNKSATLKYFLSLYVRKIFSLIK